MPDNEKPILALYVIIDPPGTYLVCDSWMRGGATQLDNLPAVGAEVERRLKTWLKVHLRRKEKTDDPSA